MNAETAAALVRGLCIDLSGKPQFVVSDPLAETPSAAGTLSLELDDGDALDRAAEKIRACYAAWKKLQGENSEEPAGEVILPACASLAVSGKSAALYWIDGDFDSANRRRLEKNAVPRKLNAARESGVILPQERAEIVKNKVALVTGAAQGIGEEIARNLAAAGAFVFIADLNTGAAENLSQQINDDAGRRAAFALGVNVADEKSVQAMFDAVARTTGGLDLCVSNAGVLRAGSVLEQELSDFQFVTDINYTGFFIMAKHAGRLLRSQHCAAPAWKTDIVQINSKSGLEGSNKNGAYAGGKFGGIGLVASFAMELVEYNVKVNAICPGNFLDGPLWSHPEKGLFVQYLNTGKIPGAKTLADVRAAYEGRVPMKRGCTGKDLVRALFYIVEQQYETGQALPVTGGQIMMH
ncbi:MAG: SDR family NAD(P)-dependent oxidoreductase [Spirochaetes bacterium]|nr:SDR family NAD(P)-dependent oxidoreductase [Spirochaetota bacterium]